ncbi:purine-binding chemotaxis protein CheW [Rheinheimera riviphila]|uniref:Chemotaxis protein CheW n=1 Tax=Rheinheimera riviphila TaxID=1834037 RepID=A0A437R1J9_9GAMM|nr:chemotaxis protein CheW [Rheinheimera riviphila]RVU40577.1 purine-binding chemotaxis protein CheW [Rheinheimera riviphila]
MAPDSPTNLPQEPLITCWKSVGIFGDRSCEKLATVVHCRNCDVYADAASQLRDQFAPTDSTALLSDTTALSATNEAQTETTATQQWLLFRLNQQWFGIASAVLQEITQPQKVRAVPHRLNKALLGVCNVRGLLVPCISLHRLLGITAAQNTSWPRMLIVQHKSAALVLPVDQIHGLVRLPQPPTEPVQLKSGSTLGKITLTVVQWQGFNLTLLDADLLHQALLKELK